MLILVMWRFSFEGIGDLFVFYYQLSGIFYEGLSFGVDGFMVLEEMLWLYVDYFFFGVGFYGFGYQYQYLFKGYGVSVEVVGVYFLLQGVYYGWLYLLVFGEFLGYGVQCSFFFQSKMLLEIGGYVSLFMKGQGGLLGVGFVFLFFVVGFYVLYLYYKQVGFVVYQLYVLGFCSQVFVSDSFLQSLFIFFVEQF